MMQAKTLRARRKEKEMKVKPTTSFNIFHNIYLQQIIHDSKQENINKQYQDFSSMSSSEILHKNI